MCIVLREQVVALPPVVSVAELAATLQGCGHQAFPITPQVTAAFASRGAAFSKDPAIPSDSNVYYH